MMRSVKTGAITLAALALVFSGLAASVSAQGLRIGFVRDDRIYQEYNAWQNAQEQWELERKSWEEEAQQKQDELQEMVAEYEKQKLILSDEKKKEREAAIRTKREALDAFTKQVYGPNGTAERKEAQLIEPLLDNIRRAMELVATENNYDVIFTLQGIGFIKDQYDVTDQVLEKLEEIEQ